MLDHSVYGYLNNRTTEELEVLLRQCIEGRYYDQTAWQVLEVLEKRYLPGVFPPHIVQLRQKLAQKGL